MGLTLDQIRALAAGATIMLVQGALYVYGGIAPYLVTNLYYNGDTTITAAKLLIILTLSIIFQNVGIFLGSLKKLKFGYRTMAFVSMVGISASMWVLSYMTSMYTYILFYGITFGVFIGYGYLAPIRNCYDYLPDRKGMGSGVCLCGFGMGAVAFTLILTQLINPDNLSPVINGQIYPQAVANNVPNALRVISIVYLSVGMVGVLLLKQKFQPIVDKTIKTPLIQLKVMGEQVLQPQSPQKSQIVVQFPTEVGAVQIQLPLQPSFNASYISRKRYRDKQQQKDVVSQLNQQKLSKQLFLYLFKKQLHLLVTILSLSAAFGIFVAFNYKSFAFTSFTNDKLISFIGSMGALANGMFRFFWGYMLDKYSFRIISTIINCALLIVCLTIDLLVVNQFGYLVIIVFCYSCYGGNYSIYPPQTVKMLGKVLGNKIYFVTFSGFSIGAIIQYVMTLTLVQHYGRDGYTYCFIIFGGMLIMAIFYSLTVDFCVYDDAKAGEALSPTKLPSKNK